MVSACKKFGKRNKGFTLLEVITATGILALITSSVWIVVDRCVNSAADMKLKIQAFEVARENLELLMSQPSVKETSEYGSSDRYPGIDWETVVETFYEPVNSQMWLRAICSASYYDINEEKQSVELVHWLTSLTKDQLLQILMQKEEVDEQLTPQLIETIEDAAIYAGVSADNIQQWLDNGMLTAENGSFIKNNLDLFKLNDGNPSDEDKQNLQIESEEDLRKLKAQQNKQELQNEVDPTTGLTYGQIEQMDIQEIWDLLKNKQDSGSE
jgi:prepilin-type N-terminal cleavage/methylation domain-containing protein